MFCIGRHEPSTQSKKAVYGAYTLYHTLRSQQCTVLMCNGDNPTGYMRLTACPATRIKLTVFVIMELLLLSRQFAANSEFPVACYCTVRMPVFPKISVL